MPGQPDDEIKKGSAAMAGLMGDLLGGGAGGGDLSSDDDSMPGIEAPSAPPAAGGGDSDDDSMPGIEAPSAPAAGAGGDSDDDSMPGLEPGAAAPPAGAGDGLDGMSVKQLRAEMARVGASSRGLFEKAEFVAAIRSARADRLNCSELAQG